MQTFLTAIDMTRDELSAVIRWTWPVVLFMIMGVVTGYFVYSFTRYGEGVIN